jgi:hypothetical protein
MRVLQRVWQSRGGHVRVTERDDPAMLHSARRADLDLIDNGRLQDG